MFQLLRLYTLSELLPPLPSELHKRQYSLRMSLPQGPPLYFMALIEAVQPYGQSLSFTKGKPGLTYTACPPVSVEVTSLSFP